MLLFSLTIPSSCIRERDCPTYNHCSNTALVLEYFGNYKPGNYWIYENQDGTKKDSIWVSEYSEKTEKTESTIKERNDCIEYPKIEFYLNAQYFGQQKMWARVSNNNCYESSFHLTDSIYHSQSILLFTATQNDDTFVKLLKK